MTGREQNEDAPRAEDHGERTPISLIDVICVLYLVSILVAFLLTMLTFRPARMYYSKS